MSRVSTGQFLITLSLPQMFVFIFMLCGSVFLMFNVTVGLDQELAMPQVSAHSYININDCSHTLLLM